MFQLTKMKEIEDRVKNLLELAFGKKVQAQFMRPTGHLNGAELQVRFKFESSDSGDFAKEATEFTDTIIYLKRSREEVKLLIEENKKLREKVKDQEEMEEALKLYRGFKVFASLIKGVMK